MGEIKLTEEGMRLISQFEKLTGAGSRDCVIDEKNERVIFLINPGEMGLAIGKKGASIKKASEVLGKRVEVVEYSPDPIQFVKNCMLPAQVSKVSFESEDGSQVAHVEVNDDDRGLVIGKEGRNISKAKILVLRQHNISNVLLD